MSKIQQLKPNYQQNAKLVSQNQQKIGYKPSFGNASDEVVKKAAAEVAKAKDSVTDIISNVIAEKSKGFLGRFCEKLGLNKGELQSQKLNAIFTCTLAPTMIALNPFSDKPKEDKKYLAARQPISAAIAIAGGTLMTIPINKYFASMVENGYVPSVDTRMSQDKFTLEKLFKSSYSETHDGRKLPLFMNKDQKQEMAKFVSGKQAERSDIFTTLLTESPDKISEKHLTEIANKKIRGLSSVDEIKDYIAKNNVNNINFGDYLKEYFNIEVSKDGNVKLSSMNKKNPIIRATDFFDKVGIIKKGSIEEKSLVEFVGSKLDVNSKEFKKSGLDLDSVLKKLGYIDENGNALESLKTLMDKKVPAVLAELKDEKKLGKFTYKVEEKCAVVAKKISEMDIHSILKNIVKTKIDKNNFKFDHFVGKWNMIFNIGMTAVTCTALNWIYPRLVEALFPQWVKNKKKPQTPQVQTEVQRGGSK